MNLPTLLADEGVNYWLSQILQPESLLALALVVAAFMGGLVGIAALWFQHRERMAKIEHGIDPDANAPKDAAERYRRLERMTKIEFGIDPDAKPKGDE
jgi:hypothetical protein